MILIVPVLLLAAMFVREGIAAARNIQTAMAGGGYGWFNHAWEWLVSSIAAEGVTVDLPGLVRQGASRAGEYMASELGRGDPQYRCFPVRTVRHALCVVLLSFGMAIRFWTASGISLPFEETMTERMLAEARELIFASVTTSLVIAAVQGIICGGAFAIVGLGSPIFWGVVMGFLSLLPVVGAWPVWIPAAIWLFSTGHAGRAIVLIAICGALGATIDNILRPVLLGGRASLNGLLVFISVLGGIAVFGVLGVVLGPIVVATAVGILDVYSGKEMQRRAPHGYCRVV